MHWRQRTTNELYSKIYLGILHTKRWPSDEKGAQFSQKYFYSFLTLHSLTIKKYILLEGATNNGVEVERWFTKEK